MQTHLNSCPVCQAEVRELEPVVTALADAAPDRIDEEPWPPGDLEESTLAPILGEIYRTRRRRRRFRWTTQSSVAAALCVVVIGLAGCTWLLEPKVQLREDAARLELRTPGGNLVFFAKLTEDPGVAAPEDTEGPSAEDRPSADTPKKPKDAGSGGGAPPKRPPPGGASPASPDPDAAPGAGGQESVPPDAGQESAAPDAGQESASPAAEKQAAPASASPAADQYYAQP